MQCKKQKKKQQIYKREEKRRKEKHLHQTITREGNVGQAKAVYAQLSVDYLLILIPPKKVFDALQLNVTEQNQITVGTFVSDSSLKTRKSFVIFSKSTKYFTHEKHKYEYFQISTDVFGKIIERKK